eukprot:TRINITY_DN7800_c0_g1_i1.p1 TRINITY_DN7800_c0_g1~~TRINITY_DN7800_c0_g1_i1.p1  ORF type:complete len:662 (+),score=147.42 TRINITY_DN7800_c0_g1_i1:58-2043(+)
MESEDIRVNGEVKTPSLSEWRKTLPAFKHREEIIAAIREHQVVVVSGETGSGKTTQVPQYILEARLNDSRMIAITQPRRVAALTLSERVAQEKGCKLGELVGYSIRFEEVWDAKVTKLKFVTDGMLLREFIIDPTLRRYSVLIIDEAHERSLHTDIILGLTKDLIAKRRDLKLVVMSATLELKKLTRFFPNSKTMHISGRTFPIEIYATLSPVADYIEATLNCVLQIHMTEEKGDVLAFLTGQEDIEDLSRLLEERNKMLPQQVDKILVAPLYAALPSHAQLRAFQPAPEGHRKIVLATNIAETSVTINGIKYVVDCGLAKLRFYDARRNMESLLIHPIAKSSALQRAGRAGRQCPGKSFRLYTEDALSKLEEFNTPEILRTNLSAVILQLKVLGVGDMKVMDLVDRPSEESVANAEALLKSLNAIDDVGNPTPRGREMAELPLDPLLANLLLLSLEAEHSCYPELLSIIALLSVENLFYVPKEGRSDFSRVLSKFAVRNSDHLTKLILFNHYASARNQREFARENFLNRKNLRRVVQVRNQLSDYVRLLLARRSGTVSNVPARARVVDDQQLIEPVRAEFDRERVLTCLAKGLTQKSARRTAEGTYLTYGTNEKVAIHPESVLFQGKAKPEHIVYNEVVVTTRTYLRDVSEVAAKDLIQA